MSRPQSALDATADAETLRRFCRDYFPHAVVDPAYMASAEGAAAQCYMREGFDSQSARDCATWAARHAFDLVPALREAK